MCRLTWSTHDKDEERQQPGSHTFLLRQIPLQTSGATFVNSLIIDHQLIINHVINTQITRFHLSHISLDPWVMFRFWGSDELTNLIIDFDKLTHLYLVYIYWSIVFFPHGWSALKPTIDYIRHFLSYSEQKQTQLIRDQFNSLLSILMIIDHLWASGHSDHMTVKPSERPKTLWEL